MKAFFVDQLPCMPLRDVRQIIAEEWHTVVKEYNLRPGTVTETFIGRVLERLIEATE